MRRYTLLVKTIIALFWDTLCRVSITALLLLSIFAGKSLRRRIINCPTTLLPHIGQFLKSSSTFLPLFPYMSPREGKTHPRRILFPSAHFSLPFHQAAADASCGKGGKARGVRWTVLLLGKRTFCAAVVLQYRRTQKKQSQSIFPFKQIYQGKPKNDGCV